MPKFEDKDICCSFCGKTNEEAGRLVAGPGVFICDECIEVCHNMITPQALPNKKSKNKGNKKIPAIIAIPRRLLSFSKPFERSSSFVK